MNHLLYVVIDENSPHYKKYVKKIYISGDGRWACQTFDKSEKMFLKQEQLIPSREWKK